MMESERHAFLRKLLRLCVDAGVKIVSTEDMRIERVAPADGERPDWIDEFEIYVDREVAVGWWDGERHEVSLSLQDESRRYDALKAIVRELPAMTAQRAEQRLDFAYGNLAIDGKASRSAFKIVATTTGLGWTLEQFDAWAEGKKWDAP